MKSAALEAEMRQAFADLRREDAVELAGRGVPKSLIMGGMIGVALVRYDGDHGELYCPDPDGQSKFVLPVRVDYPDTPESTEPWPWVRQGDLVDLVAWDPAAPNRWALRVGTATWLGCVPVQRLEPAATRIWRTPLNWLRADCCGLVLLSRDRADHYRILSHLHEIEAEDEAHARELRDVVERPWPAPRVRSPSSAAGAVIAAEGSPPPHRELRGAGTARLQERLVIAARLMGDALRTGEIRSAEVAEAALVRAAAHAGLSELEGQRVITGALGMTNATGEDNGGERSHAAKASTQHKASGRKARARGAAPAL